MANTTAVKKNPFKTIILAGLTAGTLDITAAAIQYYIKTGKGPGGVLRFIARGVFGKEAATGGFPMACWGLFFHFVIAFLFTLFFFWLYPKIRLLSKNKIVTGLVYGLFVWSVMNLIVVPMSNTPKLPFDINKAIIAMLILMFCVGLPISLITGKYYSRKSTLI